MSITDTLHVVSILIGLFFVHFVMPLLLMWLLKGIISWAFHDIDPGRLASRNLKNYPRWPLRPAC